MKIPLVGLEIEQHKHEQIQDENGADIDDDLDRPQEFRIQHNKEPGYMEQQRQQRQGAVNGMFHRHGQDSGDNTDHRKITEEYQGHTSRLSLYAWVVPAWA